MQDYQNKSWLTANIERIKAKDKELREEMESKLSLKTISEDQFFPQGARRLSKMPVKKMARKTVVTPVTEESAEVLPKIPLRPEFWPQEPMEESIALAHLRPVMVIRDNKVVPEFEGPDMAVWRDRLLEKEAVLNSVIPSIGRVEIKNNAVYKWAGTAWLIDTDIIVTNRHVANIFSKNKEGFAFKMGYPSGSQASSIDFLEEYQRTTEREFDVLSVLWMAENDPREPDVAFMKIKPVQEGNSLSKPIELADSVEEGEVVVTIGYPARDTNIPDQELVLKIFGNVYDKKRLAPGEIVKVEEHELEHDCSTLGGNSGSAVISLMTGKAVGLHFAGQYLQSNYAVPSVVLKNLLQKLHAGTLPRMTTAQAVPVENPPVDSKTETNPTQNMSTSNNAGKFVIEGNIPIRITLEIGSDVLTTVSYPSVSSTPNSPDLLPETLFDQALAMAKQTLSDQTGVVCVRKGYRFRRGWITDEKVIVVEVQKKQSLPEIKADGKKLIPQEFMGIGVDVRVASLGDRLDLLGIEAPQLEAVPRPGIYKEPPCLQLLPVTDEKMKAIFHVSPDSGWPNLRDFFGRIKHDLTGTIYEWDAQHISDTLYDALQASDGKLKMVTQKPGTVDAVTVMKQKLGDRFDHVFASVGPGRIVPSAYHIKVASRDDEEFWLSSGNWKESNQADIDPAGEHSTAITPLREHNREWHVIMENATLAQLFREYIDWDFEEAQRVPLEEAVEAQEMYLFVPEEMYGIVAERRVVAQYFEPLVVDKVLNVQPLLTPDRDGTGQRMFMQHAARLIDSATSTIDIENQSFSLLDENEDEFESFFRVLLRKQKEGVKIRIIFRDPREFNKGAKGEATLHRQLERLKDFGFDTENIKVQEKCHTKAIVVDSELPETAAVLFGSHNLTNSGALYNRDASLCIKDQEVAAYYQQIFDFDWEVLAKQNAEETVGEVRLAQPGEETPVGFRKVSYSEFFGDV